MRLLMAFLMLLALPIGPAAARSADDRAAILG